MTPFEQLFNALRGGVAFVLVLTVLVAVHELGHFLAARMYGMKVDAFAVFLGGVRKTDLRGHLLRPLGPKYPIWATAGLGAALFAFGTGTTNVTVALLGLAVLGFAVPAWIALRLEQLYHLPELAGIRRVVIGALIGGVAVTLTSGFSRGNLVVIGCAATMGAWIGLLAAYYAPLMLRSGPPTGDPSADEEMGHGAVLVEGQPVAVRFRPLWHKMTKSGVELAVNVMPLGGFVKIHGAQPQDDGSEVNIEGGQFSKGPFARFVVFAAGPIFSLVLGVLLVWVSLLGQGKQGPPTNVALKVQAGSPAAKAGLKDGDTIVAVNGQKVNKGLDATKLVRFSYAESKDGLVAVPVEVTYLRGTATQTVSITPKIGPAEDVYDDDGKKVVDHKPYARMGVMFKPTMVPVAPGEALELAMLQPIGAVINLAKIRSAREASDNVGGIGTVAVAATDSAREGLWPVVQMAGMLSISLGLMNLLPIVPLDGGQMAIALVEMFRRGKRLSPAVQGLVTNVGVLLILVLFVTVFSVDLRRIAGTPSNETPMSAPK
ncbi:MAG: site-2 protease family protein [Armatimonadetes bacterium]|nr:site-2 protease family protein [Armatimonadota bacterium]